MKKLYKLFLFLLSITAASNAYSAIFSITVDSEIQTCPGVFDAKAWVVNFTTSPGSTGPYIFTWNVSGPNPNQTGDTAFNIGSGSFAVTGIDLSDANPANNAFTQTFTVAPKNVLFANGFVAAESCFGAGDGSITSLPGGGTPFASAPSYLFAWSPGGSASQSISSLTSQDYTVTVTDANGCTVENTFTVGGPDDINLNLSIPDLDCSGNSITVVSSPSGGSGIGYSYNWSSTPGNNSPTETGLTGSLAGTSYSLTITDSDGCTNDTTFILTEPSPIVLAVAPDTINCFGNATGTAVATVAGGTIPFTFTWPSGVSTSNTENGLTAGVYTVQVVDGNGCTQTANFTIEERDELSLGLDSTDVTCNGDADGSVSGIIAGGVGPYTWIANDPANTTGNTPAISVPNLSGGTYRFSVTDNLGCLKIDSIVVNEPIPLTARFTGATEPNCVGSADGTINVSFTGGNGTETFTWNGVPFVTVNRTGLTAGNYILVITDNKGCDVTIDTTLVDPAPILGNLTIDEPNCLGGSDGRVIATPSGGSSTYTNYNFGLGFSNGPDSILTGLTSGNYSVTITDSDGCTGVSTIAVTEPANPFAITIVADSVNCNGEANGSATATPNIPLTTGPYTWVWSDGAGTTDSIVNNLAIGKYYVTTTDGSGCEIIDSVTIEEPNPIVTNITGIDLNCNGDASGSTSATISNGNTPYTWSWSTTPVQIGTGAIATAINLDANTKYFLTVTDREGCTKVDSITLTEPIAFDLYLDSFRLVKCFGESNGAIFVSDSGGTGVPSYLWDDGPTVQDRTNLTADVTAYKIVATDQNGCKDSVIQLITEPTVFAVTIDEDSVSCAGAADGSATATATGGTEGNGYLYTWTTTPVQTGATANGLIPGTYTVNVVDSNGCTASESVTIFEPIAITSTITSDSTSCSGIADGSATVTAAGGSPFPGANGYTFLWDANAGNQITPTAINLLANSPNFYRVTITDRNGCTKVDSVEVGEPTTLTLSVVNQRNVDCAGNSTGEATINVVGGTAPFAFAWENTGNLGVIIGISATQTSLEADTFRVTVTDGGGCNDNIQVIITEPDTLNADIPVITAIPPTCLGATDGTAVAIGTGGTAPYSFVWSTVPAQNTATATGLEANVLYTVTITDDSLCTSTAQILLVAPTSVEVSDTNIRNASCLGAADGFIKVTPTGGTPGPGGYIHSWNPSSVSGSATDSIFGVAAGIYQDTITDSRGCFVVETYIVTEPIDGVTMSFDTTDVSCTGADNGTAKVTAIGGTSGYTYLWSPITVSGSTTDSIFNLATGKYIVTVTDANGCTGVDSTVINPAIPITLTLDPNTPIQNVSCAGAQDGSISVIANGGAGVLALEWYLLPNRTTTIATNTNTVTNLDGGTYRILVLDGPCTDSIDVIITEPDTLKAELNKYDLSCDGTILGQAAVKNITGGNTGGNTFTWSPNVTSTTLAGDSAFNLLAGQYSVTVSDLLGCDTIISFNINAVQSSFTFTDSVRNDSCNGALKGYVGIEGIAGGNVPFTYTWSTQPGVPIADNFIDGIGAGNYSVTITDASGCDSIFNFTTLTEPDVITATILANPDTCGNGVGSASIVGGSAGILGGTGGYTVTWPGGINGLSVSNLSIGNYDVIISDANSCQTVIPFVIGNVAPFTISFEIDSTTCAGFSNGAIRVSTSSSATNPINYNWSPSVPGGATPTGLPAGEYKLTVTDANGCQAIDTVQVERPTAITIDSVVVVDESCTPGADGSATAFVQGGTPPYRYDWGDGNGLVSSNSINNLTSGQYSVLIRDQNFCSSISTFRISTSTPFTIDTPVVDDATCIGDSDGSAQINLTGAIAPITFAWPPGSGASGSNPANLRAGLYIVTVTDGTSCFSTVEVLIANKSNLEASIINKEDETCTPGADGFAVAEASNGVEPYSYVWSPNVISGAASDSAFNLIADSYTVTITDALLCSLISPVTIDPAANMSINITNEVPPTCFGDTDAEVSIEGIGGVAPYSYLWFNSHNDSTLTNVGSGIYAVTITDASNPPCIKIESVTIAAQAPISVTTSSTIESCNPGNDAVALINVTGGNAPLTFNYSGGGIVGSSPDEYTGLTAGTYTVTITDANGCSRVNSFNITSANNFAMNLTKKDPTCSGGEDGEFFVDLSGGVNPFTYTWSGAKSIAGADPKNAIAGEYTILVTDAFGCSATATDTLFNKAPITAVFNITKETCNPGNDGSATATAADGIAPYTYAWPAIPGSTPNGNTISDIPAGTYDVTITDATSCTQVVSFTVGNTAPFTVTSIQNNVSCKGLSDGDITVTVTGVSTPNTETYLWTSNVGAPNINNPSQTNLAAGSYGLTITDPGNNCIETEIFVITEPDTLIATAALTNVSCNQGGNDGAITLSPTGGTPPYLFDWGGVITKDRSNLPVGLYSVTITDANGCTFSDSYSITNLPQFTVTLDSTDISCPGARDGSINLVTTANTPTFLWNDGSKGSNRGGLFKGMYTITVTDGITNCTVVDSIFINEEDSIKMTFALSEENCSPGMDGVAQVNTTVGGTPGYTYNFSGGNPIGSDAVNLLTSGTYFVTVTDFLRCTAIDSFKINTAAAFTANFTTTDVICPGDSSGTATITTANSSGPLSFSWPLGSVVNPTQQDQSRLLAGTYEVTITDPANGCEELLNIVINQPGLITGNAIIAAENCNPGGNGSITLAASGGDSGPYTYNWAGAGVVTTAQDQINLSAGSYSVTITDGIGCTGVDLFNVGFIVNTIPNLTTLNDGCSGVGLCAGAAQVKPTGGVDPYTYRWESPTGIIPVPASTDSIGLLCAGNYFVTITDASGCDTIVPFTINAKRIILPNTLVEGETCGVTDNGSISVSPTGGAEPYTYAWSGSTFSDSSQTGLAPGAYSITITDATGCDTIVNVTIDTENSDYTITSADLSCNGTNDGTADIVIVGGNTGFTFNWSPTPTSGQNTASISNLSVGTYFVTITNTNNGCAVVESVNINPNTPINPNEVVTDESCFGQADGTISLGVVGGAGNYTYNWSSNVTAGTTDNATGLTAGTYDVTITDVAGCDTSISVQINAANDIIAQITINDATCTNTGICDGSAELIVTSTGVFSYTWTPGIVIAGNDSAAINLCPGNYAVTITNSIGCSKVEPFTIGGPTIIDPNFTVTNSTCNISNGELLATPTGGTGTLTVEWFDNTLASIGIGNSINNLAAGAYFAVIVDNVGCRDTFPTSINDIGAETISISASNNVSCFGGSDGSATVSYICNDPGCTTEWFTSGGTSVGSGTTVSGLTKGDYYVEVINNSGCLAVENITLTEPAGIVISETIIANDCPSGINGSITLSVSGGVGNFTYLWTPSPTVGQGTNSISGLSVGTYTVVISDGNSCDSTMSFDVTGPVAINSTFVTTRSNCNQADGQIVATVSGGTVATPLVYDYQWFDGNNIILVGQISDTLRNVAAGNYRLRVRDDNACQEFFNVNLSDLNGPTVVVDSVINAGCFGESNGGVFITVTGNNSPFNYNWLPTGAVSEDITNLSEGIYAVKVTDSQGCITNVEDTVFESSTIAAIITATDATCGVCNGTASVNVTGGTAPYTYLWSDGETADNTDSLCGGNYTVVVTDASGCSKAFDFGVNTIGGPTGETVSITPASCANSNDGAATVTPIGGTAPYTYLWQHNGATTNTLNNLAAGTYFVQFSDVRSCSRTVQIDITSPTAIELNPQVVSSTCNQADGSILLNVTGGQPPYSYNWGTASLLDTNFLDGLPVNIYNITVTDANGCAEVDVIPVNNTGVSFVPTPTATDVSCFGQCDGSLISNISGVPVDFIWLDDQRNALAPPNTDLQNTVCAGSYFLEITTNPQGCKSYTPVTITEPDSITLSSSIIKDISCNGDCDGQVFINTRGGNILYTYSWSDPNNQQQIPAFGLCAGTYIVTATDANGCSKTTSVTLTDPPVLTGSITSNTNLICSSDCDATATSVAAGGNVPYTFTWSGGQVGQNPTNLCFGMNVLTITDARSCSITDTIFVSAIDTVVTESFGNNLVCNGDSVNLRGNVIGSSITSFGWYLADATTLFTTTLDTSFVRPIGSYTYFLIATSGTCSDTARFDVEVSANPIVNLESTIRRFGEDPTLIFLGNTDLSYTYLWTPATDLDDSSAAQPITVTEEDITYTVLVTDTNGCFFIDSIEVIYSPNIDVPSGFTPNDDGTNDVWNIRLLEKYPNASVQIFNRWGTSLYEAPNGYTTPWDGKYDGKQLPIGTYYYLIDFKDPALKPISGPITIIR